MTKRLFGLAALIALAIAPAAAQDGAKIGFVATFSGPAAAITFSRPTSLAKRTIRSAISSGCSTMLLAWVIMPGQITLPAGTLMRSNR